MKFDYGDRLCLGSIMKPHELQEIKVVDFTELTAPVTNAFSKLWRYKLQNVYTNERVSAEYNFDLVITRYRDAVVVVIYRCETDGRILVALRKGVRPAVYLRHLHPQGKETALSPVFAETVAGGVEQLDYNQPDGIRARAAKEVLEEAGYAVSADKLEEIGAAAFSAPGFAIERIHFFCVEVGHATQRQDAKPDDVQEEVQDLEFLELSDALSMCRKGGIADQKTEVALFRFASHAGIIPGFGLTTNKQEQS